MSRYILLYNYPANENSLPKKNRDYRIDKLKYGEFFFSGKC